MWRSNIKFKVDLTRLLYVKGGNSDVVDHRELQESEGLRSGCDESGGVVEGNCRPSYSEGRVDTCACVAVEAVRNYVPSGNKVEGRNDCRVSFVAAHLASGKEHQTRRETYGLVVIPLADFCEGHVRVKYATESIAIEGGG